MGVGGPGVVIVDESGARPALEAVVEKANMARAYQVVANKGAPGADGMTVDQLTDHLKQHWPTLRAAAGR